MPRNIFDLKLRCSPAKHYMHLRHCVGNFIKLGASATILMSLGCVLNPVSAEVIFESDFSRDTGYSIPDGTGLWNGGSGFPVSPPHGWDAVKGGQGTVAVVTGAGIGGTNALKLSWSSTKTQPTVSLGKHLTGDESTGYDELYIRYRVRLPDNFRVGKPDNSIAYWKWGRLWQNTSPDNQRPNHWTENRANSGYVVWNFVGNVPYTMATATWGENTGSNLDSGSSGGPRQHLDYFISGSDRRTAPGYFESLWPFNEDTRELLDRDQQWHTIEWRFKLASDASSDDGVFEMWWDGINQGRYARLTAKGGAPDRSGIPTTSFGSGFNFLTVFDNMSGWNKAWGDPGVEGGIYVNDVVISTSPIGVDYNVNGTDDSNSLTGDNHNVGECRIRDV